MRYVTFKWKIIERLKISKIKVRREAFGPNTLNNPNFANNANNPNNPNNPINPINLNNTNKPNENFKTYVRWEAFGP